MIKGTFFRDKNGYLTNFVLTGHANSGPYGSDIVCAGVSALAISTVNGLEALGGFLPEVMVDNDEGGYLSVNLTDAVNQEQFNISQILLENLLLGLQSMAEENQAYLNVKTITE